MRDKAIGETECVGLGGPARRRRTGRNVWSVIGALGILASGACGEWNEPAGSDSVLVERTGALSNKCAPSVPPGLAVPAGNRVAFDLDARGVQIYRCDGSGAAPAWVFQAPEAELFKPSGASAGTHYAGPTWELVDGSKVVGTRLAGASVTAGAIPWLLLQATAHEKAGRMARVTFIHRVDTAGGLAPTTGCDGDHLGEVARVDYTATYYFYETEHGTPAGPGC